MRGASDGVEQIARPRDPALQPQRPHHRRVGQIHHGPPTAVEQVGVGEPDSVATRSSVHGQHLRRRVFGAHDDSR